MALNHAFFFDSYALFAIATGQESYKEFAGRVRIITTLMNLYEMYYTLSDQGFQAEAEKFFERFLPYCVNIEPAVVKQAAMFRLANKKANFSYVDALGYIIANQLGMPFLTGDDGFKYRPNVRFVK